MKKQLFCGKKVRWMAYLILRNRPLRGRFLVSFSFSDIHRDSSIKCRRLPTPNFCATKSCEKLWWTANCSTIALEKSTPGLNPINNKILRILKISTDFQIVFLSKFSEEKFQKSVQPAAPKNFVWKFLRFFEKICRFKIFRFLFWSSVAWLSSWPKWVNANFNSMKTFDVDEKMELKNISYQNISAWKHN